MRGGERRGFAQTASGAGAAVCSPTRGAEGGHGRALGGPGAPGVARHRARCGAPPARPSLPDELEAAAREAARLRPCAQAGGHRPPRAGAAPERTAEGAALHVLNSRSAFTNVCIGLKSRAAMLGKRNYLPGPNALTSWCIVLALVVPDRQGGPPQPIPTRLGFSEDPALLRAYNSFVVGLEETLLSTGLLSLLSHHVLVLDARASPGGGGDRSPRGRGCASFDDFRVTPSKSDDELMEEASPSTTETMFVASFFNHAIVRIDTITSPNSSGVSIVQGMPQVH